MKVESYPIEPAYRLDNGLFVVDNARLPFPEGFEVRERSVVHLPAGQVAGNHRHPRQECYYTCEEDVELHWIDDEGKTHIEPMDGTEGPQLFFIPSGVPHAVVNTWRYGATLIGFADGRLEDVEAVVVAPFSDSRGR